MKLTIEATINANRKKVWDFYTKPEHITQWNFAIDSWQCPRAENDLRVDGKYFARMEAKDGSFGFDFGGVYNEVIDQQKIVYTIDDGRQVAVEFKDLGTATKIITTFDAETQNPIEMQQQGWQAILNNFKKYVEGN
ncbi:MAG: SRPBCC family protein [Bacteroidetes bacterium]|nr:SRPBCC family protein [Bacteroidota bacterium]